MASTDDGMQAVLFDLDGTLLRYQRTPGEVLRASFDRVGTEPLFAVEDYYARFDEFARQCDSMHELRSECFAALAAENGYDARRGREVATAFAAERDQSNVELYPRVPDVLEAFSQEYDIGIVTNGAPDAQRQKITAVGLDRWVDTVVVAGHDTPPKPAVEPFERALASLDAAPNAAVHVGDSLETDVEGATTAGLDAVWVSETDADAGQTPTYQVTAVEDLLSPPWQR